MMPPTVASARSLIRLTPVSLTLLCVGLVVSSTLLTRWMCGKEATAAPAAVAKTSPPTQVPAPERSSEPWGELVTVDIDLEQPEEYVSFEKTTERATRWVFTGTALGRVREILTDCGLPPAQIDACLAAGRVEDSATAVTVAPPDEAVLGLPPAGREKLYTLLAQWPDNKYAATPYRLPPSHLLGLAADGAATPEILELIRNLTYTRNGHSYFSDPDLVLSRIPTADGRLRLLKALTTQTAVLARLRVGPGTDLDKVLGYWGATPGVRSKDLRPLLESLRKTPGGGTISLLYLLPKFARERLYTFPLPDQAGDPKMDCHWTALNFFNDVPDDRLQDNAYASTQIQERFYAIGKPSQCGDLVFITNAKGEVIHSAVYIADDLCFTKNGINFAQPWIIMRLPQLREVYTFAAEPNMLYYRRKEV